jgi:LPS-assembly protein
MKAIRQHILFVLSLCPALALADAGVCEMIPQQDDIELQEYASWATLPQDAIEITADYAEIFRAGAGEVSGNVRLRHNDSALLADKASFNTQDSNFSLSGNVRLISPTLNLKGEDANFLSGTRRVQFSQSEFILPGIGRGSARRLDAPEKGVIELDDVAFTTCPPGNNDWLLEADKISLDREHGTGRARSARFKFKGVPILYAPTFSFPLSDARKTGFLVPRVGSSSRTGTEIEVPVYFNLAPNYDFTFSPNWMSRRGVLLQEEFRYLTESSRGKLEFNYLPHDRVTGGNRSLGKVYHQTRWDGGWWATLDASDVSDSGYFEDLGGSTSLTSQTQLERNLQLEYHGINWSLLARVQNFQTLDDSIVEEDRPYTRAPQLLARGYWPDSALGFDLALDSELVHFDRDVGVVGTRLNVAPRLSLPLGTQGMYLTPMVEWEFTAYSLDNLQPGEERSPTRDTPIFSLDTGLVLERLTGGKRRLISTLEPRLQYVYIPYRRQDGLPVFDTGIPDLNLVQLFRRDRYAGPDRVGDTNRIAAGLTTRLLDQDSGRQYLAASLGGQYYFENQKVMLPGSLPATANSSDLFAELEFGFFNRWSLGLAHQWQPEERITQKDVVRVQYKPTDGRVINVGYRLQRNELEQTDVSFSWPIADNWNAVGRWNYSLIDGKTLDNLVGLEYESCCWAIRLVTRRYIASRSGEQDSSIMLQFNFKGLSSLGSQAEKTLAKSIAGYE